MHRANARCGKHGDSSFRHHGHIDKNAVAFAYTIVEHDCREGFHLFKQFTIGEFAYRACYRAFVNERNLIAAPIGNMAVECIVTGVAFSTFKPATINSFIACENLIPWLEPVYGPGCFGPEAFRVLLPCGIGFGIF